MMPAASRLRTVGIGPFGDRPWGTHICFFFATTQDLLETVTSYFKAGLESQEYCIWVVSGRLTKEHATKALRQAIPDLEQYLANRSFDIVSARDWYLKDDRLDLKRVIRGWRQRLRRAEGRGFAGMRFAGDTAWLETKKEWDDFLDYETALNEAMRNRRMIALCSYRLATSAAADVLDVAHTHDLALARRTGAWQAVAWRDLDGASERYGALTPREREVLHLVAEGRTSPEIASRLSISVKTVEVHRANLMRKLGMRNQTELVRYAFRRGM
jgi:DNA-binding CsgD family transcriptional regulator